MMFSSLYNRFSLKQSLGTPVQADYKGTTCCKRTVDRARISMAGIFLKTLVAFCLLRTVSEASNGDFKESCTFPTFSGEGYLAFTGKITSLFRQHNHITVLVRVLSVYRRDSQLSSFSVINAVERATSCGHQHKQGDVRLWVTKRHSSGMLTAIASLPVTMHMVDEVLKALPGTIFYIANDSAFQPVRFSLRSHSS